MMKSDMLVFALMAILCGVSGAPQISCSFTAQIQLHAEYNGEKYDGNYTHYSIDNVGWAQVGLLPMDYPGNSTTLFHPPDKYTIMNPFFKRHTCATVPIKSTMQCFQLDFDAQRKESGVKCPHDKTRTCDHWWFMDVADSDNDYYIYSDTVATNPVLDRVIVDGENMHEQYDFILFDPNAPAASTIEIPKTQPCAMLTDDDVSKQDLQLFELKSHFAGFLDRAGPNRKNKRTMADMLVNSPEALKMTLNSRNAASTWKVTKSRRFDGMTFRDVSEQMLQKPRMRVADKYYRRNPASGSSKPLKIASNIPQFFDARQTWPSCNISMIRDQGSCGSCWAFGAAESFTDRLCIAQKAVITLSPEYMISCYKNLYGCDGGYVDLVHLDMRDIGTVTDQCMPYEDAAEKCIKDVCVDQKTPVKMFKMKEVHDVYVPFKDDENVRAIQTEIMQNGPVETAFWVFADFMHYGGGIYTRSPGSGLAGGHAVKIIGWGEENGVPYWTVANSWGSDWGEDGFFRILRGKNECDIEDDVATGTPAL